MATYIIQDLYAGMLQYITEADSPEEAIEIFDSDVGINSKSVDDWIITEATPEMVEEVEAWEDKGQPGDEAPDWMCGKSNC
ncbi:hypothetical protein FGK63_20205 [Ruegeria sediminis]|uniref:Uncharacterized protein n=1 Tax=Ruegeria sediminis TaxID=2583820 RepID=A0ABY2WSN5_9RHOB|nr:hypothetical protein [Ruegeria sediminis]TMV02555.1 hypothetical protein FGK63_20205 [Ruegeria sediminis]